MKIFIPELVPMTKDFEGCSLGSYLDTVARPPVWTIGFGEIYHSDESPVREGEEISQDQAESMLHDALRVEGSHFIDAWVKTELNDCQYSALTDLIYNAGCGTFKRSPVFSCLSHGDMLGAANAILGVGLVGVDGILRRRYAEREMFLGGNWRLFQYDPHWRTKIPQAAKGFLAIPAAG